MRGPRHIHMGGAPISYMAMENEMKDITYIKYQFRYFIKKASFQKNLTVYIVILMFSIIFIKIVE